MRRLLLALTPLLLTACATPLPSPDAGLAWVALQATAGQLLMAQKLDGQRLDDGRYFQVSPGAHELEASLQFEVRGGGLEGSSESRQITCDIRVRYADFAAGRRYRLEARPQLFKAQAWLYDEQRQVLARGEVLRCGLF